MAEITEMLVDLNPWWKEEFKADYKKRGVYENLQKFLHLPQMLALAGLRRVGKTTLMFKIVEDAIKDGFEPRNIVYFSFDEFREVEIRKVLNEYGGLMEKNLRKGRYLILLDEIQKLGGWEDQLKTVYDTHKNIKIIISGSESLFIRKESRDTLAGRIFEFRIEPLTFREFLLFKGVDFEPLDLYAKELGKLFDEFILTQGFPELVGVRDRDVIRKYVKESILEKVVYADIPRLFRIKDISMIESILNVIVEEPGQIIELSRMAKGLGVSRQTLSNYLIYLEESFLIRKLYNFSKNRRKVERKLKKYYPTVISPTLLFRGDDLSRSKVLEWLMVNQLKAEFFWRDPYKKEVDIVLADEEILPVEVKYGRTELKGLLAFMKKFDVDEGYVISSDMEETREVDGKTVFVVPAFKFLLE
jgi:hypothetical protein